MIRKPKPATLKKYGLDEVSWALLLQRQRFVCGICGTEPKSGRLNIDHQHASRHGKQFRDMKAEERARQVRGLLCWTCNKLVVGRGVTTIKLRAAVDYLDAYEDRKRKEVSSG